MSMKNDINIDESEFESYTQEIDPSSFVGCGDIFNLYIKDVAKYPLLSKEEEYALAKKFKDTSDLECRQKLVNHNLRLVINIAKRYKTSGIAFIDLIQEGNLGLMIAVDKFDPDLGYRFSTYATWWIKQSILRYIANSGRLIRLPVHASESLYKYNRFVSDFKKNNPSQELPSTEEIAKIIGVPYDSLCTYLSSDKNILSLNVPVGEKQDSTLADFVPDNLSVEEHAEFSALKMCVSEVLESLNERERDVIKLRYGIDCDKPHTLEEVGNVYGITRERVRQIESRALRKLKFRNNKKLLEDFRDIGK